MKLVTSIKSTETIWTFESLGLALISPQQCPFPAWKSGRVQPLLAADNFSKRRKERQKLKLSKLVCGCHTETGKVEELSSLLRAPQ